MLPNTPRTGFKRSIGRVLQTCQVAGVPNLVALSKISDQCLVKESVCVRKQTDPHEYICDVETNHSQGRHQSIP